jgi:hypothetical protein
MSVSGTGTTTQNPFSLIMATVPVQEPVIAPWVSAGIPESQSFAVDGADDQEPVWRVNLPASKAEARAILTDGYRELADEQVALTQSFRRLELLADDMTTPGSHQLQGPEAELFATLAQSDALEPAGLEVKSGSDAGLGDRVGDWLRDTWKQVQSLIARTTWTETVIDGRLIARSALGRTGDTLTAWITDVTSEEASLHNQAVRLALASKQALLHKITLVIQGALLVTRLIVAPGSALLAVPAIWRYLNQLRAAFAAA